MMTESKLAREARAGAAEQSIFGRRLAAISQGLAVLALALLTACGPGTGGTGTGPGSAAAGPGGESQVGVTPGSGDAAIAGLAGTWRGGGMISVIASGSVRVTLSCKVYEYDGPVTPDGSGRLRVPLLAQGLQPGPSTESLAIFFEAVRVDADRIEIALFEASGRTLITGQVQERDRQGIPKINEPGC